MSNNGQSAPAVGPQQPPAILATARPVVMIEVNVGGQRLMYDVEVAMQLRQELTIALASLESDETPVGDPPSDDPPRDDPPIDSEFQRTHKKTGTKK